MPQPSNRLKIHKRQPVLPFQEYVTRYREHYHWEAQGFPYQLVMARAAYHNAMDHAYINQDREVGGILIGNLYFDEPTNTRYIGITNYISAEMASEGRMNLTFTDETWLQIDEEQQRIAPNALRVGWAHTHPDFGIFLSKPLDIYIHDFFFKERWQVALVTDPIRNEAGFFMRNDGGVFYAEQPTFLFNPRTLPMKPVSSAELPLPKPPTDVIEPVVLYAQPHTMTTPPEWSEPLPSSVVQPTLPADVPPENSLLSAVVSEGEAEASAQLGPEYSAENSSLRRNDAIKPPRPAGKNLLAEVYHEPQQGIVLFGIILGIAYVLCLMVLWAFASVTAPMAQWSVEGAGILLNISGWHVATVAAVVGIQYAKESPANPPSARIQVMLCVLAALGVAAVTPLLLGVRPVFPVDPAQLNYNPAVLFIALYIVLVGLTFVTLFSLTTVLSLALLLRITINPK